MGGMSSHVFWKQSWSDGANAYLLRSITDLGCSVEELSSQQWDPKSSSIGGVRDYLLSYVSPAAENWSSVLLRLNSLLAEPLAAILSQQAGRIAIAFFEYDQSAWGYNLFSRGTLLDLFWNKPELVEIPPTECQGNPSIINATFGVPLSEITPYLRHVTGSAAKAFDDDKYALNNHWVRVDFMRRLGLSYPNIGGEPNGRHFLVAENRA